MTVQTRTIRSELPSISEGFDHSPSASSQLSNAQFDTPSASEAGVSCSHPYAYDNELLRGFTFEPHLPKDSVSIPLDFDFKVSHIKHDAYEHNR